MSCLYHTFSPRAQGPVWKRRRKAVRVGGGGWHLPDTVGLMQRLRQHTQDLHTLRTNKVPALNRRNRHKVPPLTKKIFAPDNLLGDGVPMKGHWVLSTTLHSRSHVWPTQTGLNVFCVVFCFCLVFGWFILIEKERTWSWIGREVGRVCEEKIGEG